jgi:hypothetical protein
VVVGEIKRQGRALAAFMRELPRDGSHPDNNTARQWPKRVTSLHPSAATSSDFTENPLS